MSLSGTLKLKVLTVCKKLLKIMDKNVIFLRVFAALQNVKNILLKKIIQKIFYLSLEMKNIDRE